MTTIIPVLNKSQVFHSNSKFQCFFLVINIFDEIKFSRHQKIQTQPTPS